MFLYSTRNLGLPRTLHMLSIYLPFTKHEHGILFALGGTGLTKLITIF